MLIDAQYYRERWIHNTLQLIQGEYQRDKNERTTWLMLASSLDIFGAATSAKMIAFLASLRKLAANDAIGFAVAAGSA